MTKAAIENLCVYLLSLSAENKWITRSEIVLGIRAYGVHCHNMDVSGWLWQLSCDGLHTLTSRIRQGRADKRATAPVLEYQLHRTSSKSRAA